MEVYKRYLNDERYLNWQYVPENSMDGKAYTYNDVLCIAEDNKNLAELIIDLCYWQHPETVLVDLLIEGEVAEHNGGYVMLYDDNALRRLWDELADVPFDEDDNMEMVLAEYWLIFEAGTHRETIWRWFDEHYSKGVHALMFPSEH